MNMEAGSNALLNPLNNKVNSTSEMRKKRRSKHEAYGRDFLCKLCGKSYLSSSSLYSHEKNKHGETMQTAKEEQKIPNTNVK